MDEKTAKMIKERFDALPKMVQDVILSAHYEEGLLEIGKKYQLTVEQLGTLEQETTLTMMGLTPINTFEEELTRELHVDKIKGTQIAEDINQKVFLKIRELLKIMNTPAGEEPSFEETIEIKKEDTEKQIMKSAGIEIVPEKPTTPPAVVVEDKKTEDPHLAVLMQKLSGNTKSEVKETEHSLDNITKNPPTSYPPQKDPYRLSPE